MRSPATLTQSRHRQERRAALTALVRGVRAPGTRSEWKPDSDLPPDAAIRLEEELLARGARSGSSSGEGAAEEAPSSCYSRPRRQRRRGANTCSRTVRTVAGHARCSANTSAKAGWDRTGCRWRIEGERQSASRKHRSSEGVDASTALTRSVWKYAAVEKLSARIGLARIRQSVRPLQQTTTSRRWWGSRRSTARNAVRGPRACRLPDEETALSATRCRRVQGRRGPEVTLRSTW